MPVVKNLSFKAILMIIFGLVPFFLIANEVDSDTYEDMVKGEDSSEIVIVEYASFTCPHCATFHKEVIPKLQKEYIDSGIVKFVYREVYFDAPGLWAGLLARCANKKKYFGIVDLLYKKQDKWASGASEKEILKQLFSIGRQVGLEDETINACMQNKTKSLNMIDAYLKNAKSDQITSTPSLVINGKLYENMNYENLKIEIETILE